MSIKSEVGELTWGDVLVRVVVVAVALGSLAPLVYQVVLGIDEAFAKKSVAEAAARQVNDNVSAGMAGVSAKIKIPEILGADPQLAIDGSNEAILLFFYSRMDEQSIAQFATLYDVAAQLKGKIKFVKVDYLEHSEFRSNSMHTDFYNIHQTPTFILRRKGDFRYRTLIGLQSADGLKGWILEGLQSSADQ